MRAIKERLMGREDKELGYALDKICHKYAEVGYDTVFSLGKSLRDIAKDADTLGCSFTLQCVDRGSRSKQMDIEDFLKVAKRHLDADNDIFFDITYIDGEEPGNQYMLTINDFDGHIEEFAEFIFTPNDDDTQMLESKRSVRESLGSEGRVLPKNEYFNDDDDDDYYDKMDSSTRNKIINNISDLLNKANLALVSAHSAISFDGKLSNLKSLNNAGDDVDNAIKQLEEKDLDMALNKIRSAYSNATTAKSMLKMKMSSLKDPWIQENIRVSMNYTEKGMNLLLEALNKLRSVYLN